MKSTKTFLILAVLLIAGSISAYAGGAFNKIADTAKKANETVRSVNDVIRDVDETVEGVGGVKGGVEDIGKDTQDVLGIETPPQQTQQQQTSTAQAPAQSGGSSSAAFVLPNGEAWIKKTSNLGSGYIFQSDNTYFSINDYDGEKVGEWVIVTRGTWNVSGNNIALISSNSGAERSYTYTVSGNTLTLTFFGSAEAYTRTSGINPSGNIYGR